MDDISSDYEFEAYHLRNIIAAIEQHGLDIARQRSPAQHYDELIPTALRVLAES